jgi:hypothetical protein
MKPRRALLSLTVGAAVLAGAGAAAQTAPPTSCLKAQEVRQPHMLGLWRAEFGGVAQGATVLLEKNASYADSFSGAINRGGAIARVAGDVDDGEFTMDESSDGKWIGDVVEGSCGKEIRGTWKTDGAGWPLDFVLRKLP